MLVFIYLLLLLVFWILHPIAAIVFVYITYNLWLGHEERKEELAGHQKGKKKKKGVARSILGSLTSRSLWKAFSKSIR